MRKMEQTENLAEIEAQRAIGTSEQAKEAAVAAARLEAEKEKTELLMQVLQMNNQSKDAHNKEIKQAYKDQANQARDMSQTAMNNMGQVAASRASGGFSGQPMLHRINNHNKHNNHKLFLHNRLLRANQHLLRKLVSTVVLHCLWMLDFVLNVEHRSRI